MNFFFSQRYLLCYFVVFFFFFLNFSLIPLISRKNYIYLFCQPVRRIDENIELRNLIFYRQIV